MIVFFMCFLPWIRIGTPFHFVFLRFQYLMPVLSGAWFLSCLFIALDLAAESYRLLFLLGFCQCVNQDLAARDRCVNPPFYACSLSLHYNK